MHINLNNKVAIITGAAKGIGKIIAKEMAAEGVSLALWDRDISSLNETVQEIETEHSKVIAIECDVKSNDQIMAALEKTLAEYGTVNILVANAGIANVEKFYEMSEADWSEVHDVNTKGVFLCAKAVAPILQKNKGGRIILASSFAAIVPAVGGSAYASSKSAVASMARVMAAELGPWNITVNAYAPGMIPSNMSGIDKLTDDRKEEMLNSLSIREWGKAEDIASLVIFLSSDQARYITGSLIDASGGKFAVQFGAQAYIKE